MQWHLQITLQVPARSVTPNFLNTVELQFQEFVPMKEPNLGVHVLRVQQLGCVGDRLITLPSSHLWEWTLPASRVVGRF